jgi:hypothetical protein
MNNEFGIAMALCREPISKAIESRIERLADGELFHYIEIGVAEARTLSAVARLLNSRTPNWRATGIDIEGGWSLNKEEVEKNLADLPPDKVLMDYHGSHEFLRQENFPDIDFILIDGCHGEPCTRIDFELAESRVKRGGYVCFHDSAPKDQGLEHEIQPHCAQPIGVRAAIEKLGLLTDDREGWKLIEDVHSIDPMVDRGCLIVQKL